MKNLLILPLIFVLSLPAAAQWVTIPDDNFANKLNQLYPECMDGNQMDTTCTAIVWESYLHVAYEEISDLTGINYFDQLGTLVCLGNDLTTLPELPSSLIELNCSWNDLTEITELPGSLIELNCNDNPLTTLPDLPNSLVELKCENNQLSTLPNLPNSLVKLYCENNDLLQLPELPNSLERLECNQNILTEIPQLPNSLKFLYCSSSVLEEIPDLPNTLLVLDCTSNEIASLPELPSSLSVLNCGYNNLSQLPELPPSLTELRCYSNDLSLLPELPQGLEVLRAANNQLVCVPELPMSLTSTFLSFSLIGNSLTCLPNYVPAMNGNSSDYYLSLPLCEITDAENNPYGCSSANKISGTVFKDENTNCIEEEDEDGLLNVLIHLFDENNDLLGATYTLSNEKYYFGADTGTYSVSLADVNVPFQPSCVDPGSSQGVVLTEAEPSAIDIDFGVHCSGWFDVGTQALTTTSFVFPGQEHIVSVSAGDLSNWYGLQCAAEVSGSVTINITGPVSYVETTENALTPSLSGDIQLTYDIDDFGNVDFEDSFGVILETDTTAQAGDLVCIEVIVDPIDGDTNPENNTYTHCYEVLNSYDPNIKQVWPHDVEPGYDDYFTYTVYFQNTGNAPAFNIEILDPLDSNLDLSTFELTGYSHNCFTTVTGSAARFYFNNIMLPDSTSDFDGSIGYVQYRIKPVADLPVGTMIENTAHIYFDFNDAIVTNTTQNEYVIDTSIDHLQKQIAKVFPNPGTGQYNVLFSGVETGITTHLEVYNLSGQRVLQQQVNENRVVLDLTDYPSGMYLLHVRNARGSEAVKLLKQ